MEKSIVNFRKRLESIHSILEREIRKEIIISCGIKTVSDGIDSIYTPSFEDELVTRFGEDDRISTDCLIIDLLKLLDEKKSYNKVFGNFDLLSSLVLRFGFSYKEMLKIFEYIFTKNYENSYCSENLVALDYDDFNDIKPSYMTKSEFADFITSSGFSELLAKPLKELGSDELLLRLKYHRKVRERIMVRKPFEIAHDAVKKHFIDKRDSFHSVDLKITLKAFKLLGIDEAIIGAFSEILNKELNKRKRKVEVSSPVVVSKREEKVKISQKEYNKIFKEIESFYDIQNQKVIRPLTFQEIIYLVSLLYKINISESEIVKCLKTISKDGYDVSSNTLVKFFDYYEKMLSLSDHPEIKNALETIFSYLGEMMIPENRGDYSFWKSGIDEEVKKVMPLLNESYTYELEMGRRLYSENTRSL